ncbi:Uncharacterised protein [Kluyvera cryocrescens]|uniref:Uncharacterized protein n=1 Tax=Kluyvera cryocrescens TaxID=580 RepID=A0A485AUF9_KLUCR|nr:Uncharacterised protein [Kluyvera cryocrescens]
MHIHHALHLAGELHDRRIISRRGFHKATGAELREHAPLNPAFFRFHRLALSGGVRGAVGRFLRFNPALLAGSQRSLRYQQPSYAGRSGESAAISAASLSSNGLKSFIPLTHFLTVNIQF